MLRRSTPSITDEVAKLYLDLPGHVCFYGWRDVDVILWQTTPHVDSVLQVARTIPTRMSESGHRLSVVHVMYPRVGMPAQDARAELSNIGRRWRDRILCIGLVVEGGGLRLAAWRGVLTGIIAMSPVRRTIHVGATITATANWLSEQHAKKTGTYHAPHELRKMLEQVRSSRP